MNNKKRVNNKKRDFGEVLGELITNGILTPKRIEELFIQALGGVLDELNNKDNKDINLNNKGGDDVK